MPRAVFGEDHPFQPRSEILTFEEIARVARLFVKLGVRKIRLTGGEPLLRKNLDRLIQELAGIPEIELTLTTNGALLAEQAERLYKAGLQRVTVSLDALDDSIFRRMNDADYPVSKVLNGIEQAAAIGFGRLKINMVVKRGMNDQEILPMAEYFRDKGHILRFIEYMDVGTSNGWQMHDVVPSQEVLRRLNDRFPLDPIEPNYPGEVAERWVYRDGCGEIGLISSVSRAFCSNCTRIRLSTEGQIYTCLFAQTGYDLRSAMRQGVSDEALLAEIASRWSQRSDRYSALRLSGANHIRKIEMSYIGG